MKQVTVKDGRVVCSTTVPYDTKTVKQLKAAGFKVKNA